jgi:hypothetical protein
MVQAELNSLAGSWVLDRSRSEAMEPYLQCMGVADLAIEAQAKCEADSESRNVISIDGQHFAIHKRTKINALTEHYELGVEKELPARHGVRRTTVALKAAGSQSAVVVTTNMPTPNGDLHLIETRALVDRGNTLMQVCSIYTYMRSELLYKVTSVFYCSRCTKTIQPPTPCGLNSISYQAYGTP